LLPLKSAARLSADAAGGGDKAAFRNHAFRVVDAKARMGSVDLVKGIHDLGHERGVVGAG